MILRNREEEISKKKLVRNKIHDDLLDSRAAVRTFFIQKHDNIVSETNQEIRRLNLERAKKELEGGNRSEMGFREKELQQLRESAQMSRVSPKGARKQLGHEEKHPLVRRIEQAMNKFTKFL